ncbi:MAG: trimeric autotransporter adhesin [Thermoleophilaceae bacterium]|nr:trimeric autotransporter adhesin [Thermoleophilaceae bacterium]
MRLGWIGVSLLATLTFGAWAPAALAVTIPVTTALDQAAGPTDAKCSLREAVSAANTNLAVDSCPAGGGTGTTDTITLGTGTFPLSISNPGGTPEDLNASGDIDISSGLANEGVIIQGAGASATTVDANVADRVFQVTGGDATIKDMTVKDGNVSSALGGGALSAGASSVDLVVQGAVMKENTVVGGGGGAIRTAGDLTVTGSTIGPDNSSTNGGGGITVVNGGTGSTGGVTITGSRIGQNTTSAIGGGGVQITDTGSTAGSTITDSSITSNQITGGSNTKGAGILVSDGGLTVTGSNIEANTGADSGGGISFEAPDSASLTMTDSSIQDNEAQESGGGLRTTESTGLTRVDVTSNRVRQTANAPALGGGIQFTTAGGDITDSDISGNSIQNTTSAANSGGGIEIGSGVQVNLLRSLVSGNSITGSGANKGGGVHHGGNILSVFNTTFSGNTLPDANGEGGAIEPSTGGVTIAQSTFKGNKAAVGDALGPAGGTLNVARTVIDNEEPSTAGGACTAPAFTVGVANVDRGSTCFFGAAASNIDPQLGPLQNNGGPTRTHLPVVTGPLIDKIALANCLQPGGGPLLTDQRFKPRPFPAGGLCDIGAVENQGEQPVVDPPPSDPVPVPDPGAGATCNGLAATITGTDGAETLRGTAGADVIAALGGNDRVSALGGNDVVCGGEGNDKLGGGGGNDKLFGEAGKDALKGQGGKDLLNAGTGKGERCTGGGGRDRVKGCEKTASVP